jgi:integrase
MDRQELSLASFRSAADIWLADKKPFLGPRTLIDYMNYIKILSSFFADMPLNKITIGNIRAYQNQRKDEDGVGAVAINHEVGLLRQILTEAGLWKEIKPYYHAVRGNDDERGVALSEEDLAKLFKTARKDTRWEVALHASILSAQSTAGPGEIKNLRLRDIDLTGVIPIIYICKGTKNQYRVRTLPLNKAASVSVRFLMERAAEKGSVEPDHYLLPHRARVRGEGYDPTRHQGHWNKAWNRMRNAAGFPNLRQYDLRHTAITRLLENPHIPERVVVEIAGHVSNKMLTRYSHQRIEAKRVALAALDSLDVG